MCTQGATNWTQSFFIAGETLRMFSVQMLVALISTFLNHFISPTYHTC